MGAQIGPLAEKSPDRLDRDVGVTRGVDARAIGFVGFPGRVEAGGGARPDIEGDDIVAVHRAAAAEHGAGGGIEPDRFVLNEFGPGGAAERREINMGFIEAVMPGDQAGQHAGIRGVAVAPDQHDPHARHRTAREPAQHLDMAVATADQDEGARR
jgi:hypothetical protein